MKYRVVFKGANLGDRPNTGRLIEVTVRHAADFDDAVARAKEIAQPHVFNYWGGVPESVTLLLDDG